MSQNEHNLTSNSTGFATSLFKIIRTSHEGPGMIQIDLC